MVSAQGVKDVNPQWFNPYEKILESKAAREFISPESVRIFHELKGENKLPSWIMNQFDIELLNNLKN
jgi:hypothetical protein